MALCVASHYRNTPNDLLLMADAPAHRLFVLLGPVDDTLNALPDILAVVQVRIPSVQGIGLHSALAEVRWARPFLRGVQAWRCPVHSMA